VGETVRERVRETQRETQSETATREELALATDLAHAQHDTLTTVQVGEEAIQRLGKVRESNE
jgi:hypothetical protein